MISQGSRSLSAVRFDMFWALGIVIEPETAVNYDFFTLVAIGKAGPCRNLSVMRNPNGPDVVMWFSIQPLLDLYFI